MIIHYVYYALLVVCFIETQTQKITIIIFLWNFEIIAATQGFFLCFHWLTKPTTFRPAVMTKPLFAKNVFGLTLVLCIVFIADFFSLAPYWKVLEYKTQAILYWDQNCQMKWWNYYQLFCRCCSLHMLIKIKRKTYLSDIPLKCWKFPNKKCNSR